MVRFCFAFSFLDVGGKNLDKSLKQQKRKIILLIMVDIFFSTFFPSVGVAGIIY